MYFDHITKLINYLLFTETVDYFIIFFLNLISVCESLYSHTHTTLTPLSPKFGYIFRSFEQLLPALQIILFNCEVMVKETPW